MKWEVWINGQRVDPPPLLPISFSLDGRADYHGGDLLFAPRHTTLTWGSVADYIDPVLLAECRPGGGPHPILHRAAFQRLVRRTVRRHQRGHR